MSEIIEYEPKRKRSDIPFWIAAFLGVLLFIAWSVNDNRRMQESRDAKVESEKDRRHDAKVLRELEAQTDATNRAARDARKRDRDR